MMALVVASLLLAAGFAAVDGAPAVQESTSDLLVYVDASGALEPVRTIADWGVRRGHVIRNMQLVMGDMPDRAKAVPLDVKVIEETDCQKYVRKKITIAVESWDRLPAYLLIPKGLKAKVPGIVCLHPTSEFAKEIVVGLRKSPNRNYAEELAERGYVTLAPDYPGFGEYVGTRKTLYEKDYVSCTMKGIWNHVRCVDLLQSLPEVDGSRIGCIGHSLGGHNTLFLGVFDERVKALVSSCGFNAFPKYMGGDLTGWTHDGYMPRIASVYGKDPAKIPFDFTEILGALAPRAVFVNAPLHDANFEVSGVDDCVRAALPVFELYGAKDKLRVVHPDAEHDFPPETRQEAYAFLDAALR